MTEQIHTLNTLVQVQAWLGRVAGDKELTPDLYLDVAYHVGCLVDTRARMAEIRRADSLASDNEMVRMGAEVSRKQEAANVPKTIRDFEPGHWKLLEYAGWMYYANPQHWHFTVGMAVHSTDMNYMDTITRLRQLEALDLLEQVDWVEYGLTAKGRKWLMKTEIELDEIQPDSRYVAFVRDHWEYADKDTEDKG